MWVSKFLSRSLLGVASRRRSGFFQEWSLLRITRAGCRCLETLKCLPRKRAWGMRKSSEICFLQHWDCKQMSWHIFSVPGWIMLSTVALWQALHPISTWNNHPVRTLLVRSALCSLQPAEQGRDRKHRQGGLWARKEQTRRVGAGSYHLAIIPVMLPSCLSYILGLFVVRGK